ncbi:MAG: alpha/beta hydrolase [bacterium]
MDARDGSLVTFPEFGGRHVEPRTLYVRRSPDPPAGAPLLIMQDGQDVVGDGPDGGDGWRLAEAMEHLSRLPGVRVPTVAALASTSNRAGEYFPEKALTGPKARQVYQHHVDRIFKPCADDYLSFLVAELMPFMRDSFDVSLQDVTIAGCSRGALLSVYAMAEYPELFTRAGCLSPHWPHGDGIVIDWLEMHMPSPEGRRVYFDYGDQGLDAEYEPYQRRMDRLMEAAGFTREQNWITRSFPGHGHSAEYWAQRLPGALEFLLGVAQ